MLFQKSKIAELQVDGFPDHRFSFKPYPEIAAIEDIEETPLFGMLFGSLLYVLNY